MGKLRIDIIGVYGDAMESNCAVAFDVFSRIVRNRWGYGIDQLELVYTSGEESMDTPSVVASRGEQTLKEWNHAPTLDELKRYLAEELGEPGFLTQARQVAAVDPTSKKRRIPPW